MILFLASQSARRRDILRQMKIPFRVVKSAYRERPIARLDAQALVLRHAVGKARGAIVPKSARLVLGADTTVAVRGKCLGKPRHFKEAARMVASLSGREHVVCTGLALRDLRTGKIHTAVCCTRVRIKKMSRAEIETYLRRIHPYDKAGSYAIQEGPRIVARYEGSHSNVIGLPRRTLRALFRKAKIG